MIALLIFLWLFIDVVILAASGNNDKQDILFDNVWLTWTIMLPLTIITFIIVVIIQVMGKK